MLGFPGLSLMVVEVAVVVGNQNEAHTYGVMHAGSDAGKFLRMHRED